MSLIRPILLGIAAIISSCTALAQMETHPAAEKAMAKLVLKKNYGDKLKFHSRKVVTMAENPRVRGLHGLAFVRWKGDDPGTEVMASVQWFADKADLMTFYAMTTKRRDFELGELDGTAIWKMGKNGYSWTDGEHFLISLGGSPAPPEEMVKDWLALISSQVAKIEGKTGVTP